MAAPVGVKSHPRRVADGFNADSKTESALVVVCVLLCNRVRVAIIHDANRWPITTWRGGTCRQTWSAVAKKSCYFCYYYFINTIVIIISLGQLHSKFCSVMRQVLVVHSSRFHSSRFFVSLVSFIASFRCGRTSFRCGRTSFRCGHTRRPIP